MNKLQEKVCGLLSVKRYTEQKWLAVRCIYHNDKHPSAAVIFSDGGGWFKCKGCKKSVGLRNLWEEKGTNSPIQTYVRTIQMPEEHVNGNGSENLTRLNTDLEILERFEEEKYVSVKTVNKLGGIIVDDYLCFRYGFKGRMVGRNMGEVTEQRPRFINETGAKEKGLFGEERISQFKWFFLVEGLTDYLVLIQMGILNVLLSFGAELSDEQAYLLRGKTVFIIYDRDFSGNVGAKQAAAKLVEWEAKPIICELYVPKDHDHKIKIDVNFLYGWDEETFRYWLEEQTKKYETYDANYLQEFKKKQRLKYWDTDVSLLRFTQGLYIIGGEPGVGKTTLTVSCIDRLVEQNARILCVENELPKDQIIARLASRKSKYPWARIEEDHSLIESEPKVEDWLGYVLSKTRIMNDLTIEEIHHMKDMFDVAVIDLLQDMPSTISDPRIAIETNLKGLIHLAKKDGKTIICASRMPAINYGKQDGHLFSGSAAILSSAQGAIVLDVTSKEEIRCNLRKNTRGPTGTTFYKTNYPHQRIKETSFKNIMREIDLQKLDLED